ncbi:efflux RND transporter permease subunit [Boseongicola aestuarii]|uniref:Cobalt-zinc-cadmium resistance protein CzcA n=1 Tax=Boseongicola aestuarii TaxID=1470561 RepID=A0A238J0G6_9RHOB|nr:efflux RND transporter permease subunit [Boseongicola aestuarii]SMX23665.1 Cobalt-zinc-cadmium resistance protein CzcA [Boseongicola aestuarii]
METLTFRQPRLVALILLVLISAGLSSFLSLGRQEDPTITNIFAVVTTSFPGADPARVEALVTSEIEDELREISEVNIITSVSRTGVSVVSVELLETLDEATIEQVWSEARDAVEDARRDFPAGVQPPEFNAEGISAYSAVISVTADHDDVPITLAHAHAEALADRLRSIPSTRAVDLFGEPEEEVLVTVDQVKAAALGLTPAEISARIAAADGKVQAGHLLGGQSDLTINISGEIDALDRLSRIVLRESDTGAVVTVTDIAEVTRGAREPAAELAIANGRPAVLIGVLAQDGVQIDRWMEFVRSELSEGQAAVPQGISETLLFDQSTYTADRLAEVGTNMAIGVSLVVAVLFITLGVRAAAIVALVLPVVSLATLATMNFIGLPIHQMSVTGLIVALGLLVDAAIVMVDEVRQRLARGMDRQTAAGEATRRLAAPLLASTVTTALSFTPMILLPGPAGDFVGAIAIAVVLMLVWSLLIALTVTPALAGWFLKADTSSGLSIPPLGRLFHASIYWSVRHPIKSVALSLILPVMGFAAFPTLTAQFFPGVERDQFHLEIDMPPGTAISQTAEVAGSVDEMLRDEPGIDRAYWSLGKSGPAFYYNITGGRSQEPGYAQAMVTTETNADAARLVPELQDRLDTLYPEARIIVRNLVQGPPVAAPVEVRIVGPDLGTLRALGDEARALMADLPLVTQVRSGVTGGAPQVRFDIDETNARLLGFDVTSIASQLQASLVGMSGGSLVEGTDQLPVRVRFDETFRADLGAIAQMPVVLPGAAAISATGALPIVPLSALATPVLEPAPSVITRRNGERMNTVQAFIVPDVLPEEALQSIFAGLEERGFEVPAGYRLELGGDSDARSNTVGNLLASVGLIVTLTIATIALTFNSFRLSAVALVVCVLSAGLSMLSLAIMQFPFGINSIIGVIGSIGVSINAAIIILTGLQGNAEANAGDRAAMADVVTGSSRHIISTTITTFGGFLPLIFAGGGFWPPFAVAIAGGVLLSAVVSFYFTPAMFALIQRRVKVADVCSSDVAPIAAE